MDDTQRLVGLVDAVVATAAASRRRLHDTSTNRARAMVQEAEERVAELEHAAREIGRVRGASTQAAFERDADQEIGTVVANAFDRLFDRFLQRVRMALEALPEDAAAYAEALVAWAQKAAVAMTGPTEVLAAPRDQAPLYDALLAAGVEDFRVLKEERTRAGFVVRDLDGRTLLDVRPEALVEAEREALREILAQAVPDAPKA